MPSFGPIKRSELIRYLKSLGFEGPFPGSKHQFMKKDDIRLTLPNPHKKDIGRELLSELLKQAQIERSDWEEL
ncbi:MAG: type II toxin-antitoxin system HicA family toxin [Thermostichus sp. BF3_bins_97]